MKWHVRRLNLPFSLVLLCCTLALLAPAHTADAEASKPHPLWGNTILGNSAEPVIMWTNSVGNSVGSILYDYTPDDANQFTAMSNKVLGPALPSGPYQQLDLASADFDGDGDDDLLYVYSAPTPDTYVEEIRLLIPQMDSDLLDWSTADEFSMGYVLRPTDAFHSSSNLRVIPGQFNADDEALEFALGYRAQRGLSATIENGDIFGHTMIAIDDLDGDGIRELAVCAFGDDDGGTDRGAVWILWLAEDGSIRNQSKISSTEGGFVGPLANGIVWVPAWLIWEIWMATRSATWPSVPGRMMTVARIAVRSGSSS